jgi:hypothetical protein
MHGLYGLLRLRPCTVCHDGEATGLIAFSPLRQIDRYHVSVRSEELRDRLLLYFGGTWPTNSFGSAVTTSWAADDVMIRQLLARKLRRTAIADRPSDYVRIL